jgi:DNA-binding transcriptional LysR family regulator
MLRLFRPSFQSILLIRRITFRYGHSMLEPLRHFMLVAQYGTITAAARHAHVTQPALTASIQRLEGQLGGRLLDRGRGGAVLTAAGEALLPRARAALAAVEEGKRAVAEVMGLTAGTVRVGAGATVCTYYLPRFLAQFRAKHAGVGIHLREANQDDLVDAVESGDLDLAILTRVVGPSVPRGLVREKWIADELVLVAAPNLASPDTAPIVTLGRGTTTRMLTDRYFPERAIAMELGSIAAVKANTRAGVGVALLSRHAIERDLTSKSLEIIASSRTPVARPFYLVHRGKSRLPPAAGELHRLLKRV